MTITSDVGHDAGLRDRILDAAIDELIATHVASFTLEGVAARTNLPEQSIRQIWPSSPALLQAAMIRFGTQHLPVPDTGTLRGDLLAYATSYAAMLNSPIGRGVLHAVIVRPRDWDLSEGRPAILETRFLRFGIIIERAVERGECVPGVDPVRIIDMLGTGLCLPILIYDRPVGAEDCEAVVDSVLNGITARR